MAVTYNRGPKSSSSRWASFQMASKFHDPCIGTMCYVLSHLAKLRGWAKSIADLEKGAPAKRRLAQKSNVDPGRVSALTGPDRW